MRLGARSSVRHRVEPGMVLYRFDGPLFFANADVFRDDVTVAVAAADPPARWVVLDMESIADTHSTATQMLVERLGDLAGQGVTVAFEAWIHARSGMLPGGERGKWSGRRGSNPRHWTGAAR